MSGVHSEGFLDPIFFPGCYHMKSNNQSWKVQACQFSTFETVLDN